MHLIPFVRSIALVVILYGKKNLHKFKEIPMKNLFVLLSVLMIISCAKRTVESEPSRNNSNHSAKEQVISSGSISSPYISVIVVDEHDYIFVKQGYAGGFVHSESCKNNKHKDQL
jgi:hypothetical protein